VLVENERIRKIVVNQCGMAERVGFEPTVRLRPQRFRVLRFRTQLSSVANVRLRFESRRTNRAVRFLLARVAFANKWVDETRGRGDV
jgi:hypothetical protein